MSIRIAVFASGGGSNLQALLDRFQHTSDVRVVLVISDRDGAGALDRARRAHVDCVVIPVVGRPVDFAAREMLAALDSADVDLIALAGYLRMVPPAVVRNYRNRIVNIHPALLPAFGGKGMFGMRVHRAVLAAGATVSGATVHLVDEWYDEGRIIAQWPVPVLAGDSPEKLAGRVLKVEHLLFPAALEAVARAREAGETGMPPMWPVHTAAFALSDDVAPTEAVVRAALGLEL